jgi:hypothetical protein
MRMAEEFTGVPADGWLNMRARVDAIRDLLLFLAVLVLLLLAALIRKGILAGPLDLLPGTGTAMSG